LDDPLDKKGGKKSHLGNWGGLVIGNPQKKKKERRANSQEGALPLTGRLGGGFETPGQTTKRTANVEMFQCLKSGPETTGDPRDTQPESVKKKVSLHGGGGILILRLK